MQGALPKLHEHSKIRILFTISPCNLWKRYTAISRSDSLKVSIYTYYMVSKHQAPVYSESIPNIGENQFSIFKCILGIRKHSTAIGVRFGG